MLPAVMAALTLLLDKPSVVLFKRLGWVYAACMLIAFFAVLERQGLLESRPQSGYYVRPPAEGRLPEPEISSPRRDPSLVSLHELVMILMRDSSNPDLVQLGAALPHLDSQLIQKVNQIITKTIRDYGGSAH